MPSKLGDSFILKNGGVEGADAGVDTSQTNKFWGLNAALPGAEGLTLNMSINKLWEAAPDKGSPLEFNAVNSLVMLVFASVFSSQEVTLTSYINPKTVSPEGSISSDISLFNLLIRSQVEVS